MSGSETSGPVFFLIDVFKYVLFKNCDVCEFSHVKTHRNWYIQQNINE